MLFIAKTLYNVVNNLVNENYTKNAYSKYNAE